MRLFQRALLAFSFLIVAVNSNAQLAVLDGNWYSTQWKYGYVLKDGVGMATSTNSPNFQVGQNIIQLTATSPNTFTGQQVYTDGKFYKVNAKLQADGRLYFEGEKNAKWVMDRIGAAPQASAPSSQSTQPTTSAAASASTSPSFDCRKATTAVEKLICSNPDLSKLDVSLAETYKEAVSKDRSIRDDQRAWNAEKNKCADVDCLKSAYEDRISELTNFIVQHDRAALNQDQASTNTSGESGSRSDLDFLFKQGGYWVVDETRPGQSCSSVLAQENFAQSFKRYSTNQTELFIRIGGRHPSKNDPSITAQFNRNINVPTQYVLISDSPNTRLKVATRYPNGAVIEELLELSRRNNTIVKYGVGSCSNCDQAQLRFHQNFSGPKVMQWCSGNIEGASQTQPSATSSNANTARPAPKRDQAVDAIKVSAAREWVKGWGRHVNYLNIQSAVDEITISKVVMNRGNCQFRYATTVYGGVNLPARFKFGDTVKVDIDHCDLIEAEITTNLGTATYSFRK